jgi:hypothetical protein
MFKDLMAFAMVRTPLQAFGFYIVYFLIGLLVGALGGTLGGAFTGVAPGADSFAVGAKWGLVFVVPYVLLVGLIVAFNKKLGLGYYVLALVGAILAVLGGGLLGLIPAAFMTTRQGPHSPQVPEAPQAPPAE